MSTTTAITFDNIAQDETPFCGTHHHRDDTAGYVIVLTEFGRGRLRDVAVYDNPAAYGDVVALAHDVRRVAGKRQYARIDVLYTDGCRHIL